MPLDNTPARLTEAVATACPIEGMSINATLRSATFRATLAATNQQVAAAQAVIDGFDWSEAAQAAWLATRYPEREGLKAAAAGAVSDNDTFLALASPTNAQVLAQVRRLTQQNTRIIRRLSQVD